MPDVGDQHVGPSGAQRRQRLGSRAARDRHLRPRSARARAASSSRVSGSSSTTSTRTPASWERAASGRPRRRRQRRAPRRGRGARQPPSGRRDREGRALALAGALGAHRAAVQLDEVADDRQPEPQAAVRRACCCCRPGGSGRRRTAGTRARCPGPCRSPRARPRSPARSSAHLARCPPRGRELDRVGEQVPDHLLQAARRRRAIWLAPRVERQPAASMPLASAAGRTARAPPRRRRRGRPAHARAGACR